MNASRTNCFSIELARIRISNALTSTKYCFKLRSAGLKSRFKNDTAAVGGLACRSEYRLGFSFGVAEVFAGDFVRQVVADRPAYKRFGDEIECCDMGVEVLTERQGRVEPFLCYRCLV